MSSEPLSVAARRVRVAQGVLAGRSYRDLADELDCSHGTIGNDVTAIRERWSERASLAYDTHVAEALAVLDRTRSFDLTVMEDSGQPLGARQAARDGLHANHDRRARLLGLDQPLRSQVALEVPDLDAQKARAAELLHLVDRQRSEAESARLEAVTSA